MFLSSLLEYLSTRKGETQCELRTLLYYMIIVDLFVFFLPPPYISLRVFIITPLVWCVKKGTASTHRLCLCVSLAWV